LIWSRLGVPFIANADLVGRFRKGAPLIVPDPAMYYGRGAKGYIDYPTLEATLNSEHWPVNATRVLGVLEGDRIRQISPDAERGEKLGKTMDYDIAGNEEGEQLEEEHRVQAAAEANRG
jgi:hypothetical protein